MSKADRELDDLFEGLATFAVIGFLYLWFTNRAKFYIYAGIIILVLIAGIIVLIKIRKNKYNQVYDWHADRGLLKKLQSMHPSAFEDYIADLYSRLGYDTELVGGSYDGGIDVIAQKDGIKHYIQCKKFITSKVGVSQVRDFYGAMAGKLSKGKGLFITTNIFTTEAEKFAEDKPIELIDGDELLSLIKVAKKDLEMISEGNNELAKCPRCGGDLVEKKGKFGMFFGCSNYPKCRFTKNT
jgi:restriction system protein